MRGANERSFAGAIPAALRVEVFEFHDEEDGQIYFWNATAGRKLAERSNREIVTIYLAEVGMTKERILSLCPCLDVKYAMSRPTLVFFTPLLFVEHNGKHVLIDGWHRIYKAACMGTPCLPAYILTQAEADSIRVEGVGTIDAIKT